MLRSSGGRTKSLVLEGIVGGGFDEIPWRDRYTLSQVQAYYDSLPRPLVDKINRGSAVRPGYAQFFPSFAKSYLLQGGSSFLPSLTSRLLESLHVPDDQFWISVAKPAPSPSPLIPIPPFEGFVNQVLMIKEFGQGRCDISDNLILENSKIRKTISNPRSEYCIQADEWGVPSDVASRRSTYDPVNFPVDVPVFYLQGDTDSATAPAWGIHHSRVSPRAGFQFFLFQGVGHSVGGRVTDSSASPRQRLLFTSLFREIISGRKIPDTKISEFNTISVYPVVTFETKEDSEKYFTRYFAPGG